MGILALLHHKEPCGAGRELFSDYPAPFRKSSPKKSCEYVAMPLEEMRFRRGLSPRPCGFFEVNLLFGEADTKPGALFKTGEFALNDKSLWSQFLSASICNALRRSGYQI